MGASDMLSHDTYSRRVAAPGEDAKRKCQDPEKGWRVCGCVSGGKLENLARNPVL